MEYLLGSPNDFYDFVNSISEEDKVGVVTHTDVDGIVSGIFLQKILESRDIKINSMDFLDYGATVLKDYSELHNFDFLFILDWNADEFPQSLDLLKHEGKVLLIDHHPLNESLKDKSGIIKTDSSYCTAHTLFDLAKKYFNPEKLVLLACSAIITDYTFANDNEVLAFLKKFYPSTEINNAFDSVPGKLGKKIFNSLVYYKPNYKKVYDLVLKDKFNELDEASDLIRKEIDSWINIFKNKSEFFPKRNLYFFYGNPKHDIGSVIATILGQEYKESSVIFVLDKFGDKNHIRINARNQTGKVKLGEVLKNCIKGFENSTAGGHDRAAGGDFPKKYLSEFKERLLENL